MLRALVLALLITVIAGGLGAAVSPEMCAGALLGSVIGGGSSLVSMARVRSALAQRSERAMQALVEGFLFKLVLLGAAIAAFRLSPALAARADWRAFLIAFGTAAVTVLFAAVYELHQSRAGARSTKGHAA